MSVRPASRAQTCRRRPPSGSPPLPRATALVERQPLVHDRELRVPDHAAEVAVAGRDEAAGPGDPAHLPQRQDRVAQVLEDLVGEHHVEGVVRVVEGVDVAGREVEVRPAAGQLAGLLDDPARTRRRR